MVRYILSLLMLLLSSCAIGTLEDASDSLKEAEKSLDEIQVSVCMTKCDGDAEACVDYANGECIDICESANDFCESEEDDCFELAKETCSVFTENMYVLCIEEAKNACEHDCDQQFSDCGQQCGVLLKECLFTSSTEDQSYSECIRKCIKSLEDVLKDIEI